jgi:hypothetical protein
MIMLMLLSLGIVALVTCMIWVHWLALRDGAFHDAVLFLTGVSITSYVVTRWDEAKRPVLGAVVSLLLIALALLVG